MLFCLAYLSGPAGYWPLLLFNIVNGFAQSTGWPSNIGIPGNISKERGGVMADGPLAINLVCLAKGLPP